MHIRRAAFTLWQFRDRNWARHPGGGANLVFADCHAAIVGNCIRGGIRLPYEWPVIDPARNPAN